MNKRILFVDDEPLVLQGIKRSMRAMRAEWEVEIRQQRGRSCCRHVASAL